MKIIAIEEKAGIREHPGKYLDKIANALNYSPDLVVGPDYALSLLRTDKKLNFDFDDFLDNELSELSSIYYKTIIIPGTRTKLTNDGKMTLSAPLFINGEKIYEFYKESDRGESDLANKNNLIYEKGDNTKNKFIYNGKKIAIEICSDHGKQAIDKDTFLEIILTYDKKAGFWIGPTNDDFKRYAVICDGQKPFVDCQIYNPNNSPKLKCLNKIKLEKFLWEFNLE